MSIRVLTRELCAEADEVGRRDSLRAPGRSPTSAVSQADAQDARPSIGGTVSFSGKREPNLEAPRETTTPIRLTAKKQQENRWGIPGGIKARFGRKASGFDEANESGAMGDSGETESEQQEDTKNIYSIDIELQTNLHDFILRNCEKAKHDENLIENVPLMFHEGQGALPVARFPGWTDDLNLSPTAGMYPEPGEQWICTVDASGLIYPIEKIQ